MGMGGRGRRPSGDDFPPMKMDEEFFKARMEEERKNLDKLYEYMKKYRKPVIVFNHNAQMMKDSPVFNELKENGVMMYPTPERGAKVLARLVEYSRYLNSG